MVGAIDVREEVEVKRRIEKLRHDTDVQVILRDTFIPAQEVQSCFQMSDLVLAPYQHHVGMSGILVRAAAAGKPVLSSDYGLMGELTRRHALGYSVDSTKPEDIARAVSHFLEETGKGIADARKMAEFAALNTVDNFSRTILDRVRLRGAGSSVASARAV